MANLFDVHFIECKQGDQQQALQETLAFAAGVVAEADPTVYHVDAWVSGSFGHFMGYVRLSHEAKVVDAKAT